MLDVWNGQVCFGVQSWPLSALGIPGDQGESVEQPTACDLGKYVQWKGVSWKSVKSSDTRFLSDKSFVLGWWWNINHSGHLIYDQTKHTTNVWKKRPVQGYPPLFHLYPKICWAGLFDSTNKESHDPQTKNPWKNPGPVRPFYCWVLLYMFGKTVWWGISCTGHTTSATVLLRVRESGNFCKTHICIGHFNMAIVAETGSFQNLLKWKHINKTTFLKWYILR